MFGIKSSGCFLIGTVVGFLLAAILGIGLYFFLNPDDREENVKVVEEAWDKFKNNGDQCIREIKKYNPPDKKQEVKNMNPSVKKQEKTK